MLNKNTKGFTLIELIVSICILSICSAILILGIMNMTNIFAEGADIKNKTNTIYDSILSKIGTSGLTYDDTYVLNLAADLEIVGFSDVSDKIENPYLIKMTYLDPKLKAEKLPIIIEEPDEPVEAEYGACIVMLKDFNHVPTTVYRFSQAQLPDINAFEYLQIVPNQVLNCIKINTGPGRVFGPSVKEIVVNNPEQQFISTLLDDYATPEYKAWLKNGYTVRYISVLGVGDGETYRYLFCYLIPIEKGVYINYTGKGSWGSDKVYGIWVPWTDINKLDSLIPTHLKNFSTTISDSTTKTYTREQLLSQSFISDLEPNETFFSFYGQ